MLRQVWLMSNKLPFFTTSYKPVQINNSGNKPGKRNSKKNIKKGVHIINFRVINKLWFY